MDFQNLLRFAVESGASDIHVQAWAPPMLRIGGEMRSVEAEPLSNEETRDFIASMVPKAQREDLDAAMFQGFDFSYAVPTLSHFRCSAYSHLGKMGVVMRIVRTRKIPSLDELNLPAAVQDIARAQRGLTLLTGTAGCGKSTTLAAMLEIINTTYAVKVLTIEDPVEYIYTPSKAFFSQLEVGSDTPSFECGLQRALRQDPDVIVVGELRDVDALRLVLRAVEAGHQVFSTLHSGSPSQALGRIITMFPPAEHKLLLAQLAGSVEAIISQKLLTIQDGTRRPALEILRGSITTEKLILEDRLDELSAQMESGSAGMQTFDEHLLRMYRDKLVSGTQAMRWASNPEVLALALRSVKREG